MKKKERKKWIKKIYQLMSKVGPSCGEVRRTLEKWNGKHTIFSLLSLLHLTQISDRCETKFPFSFQTPQKHKAHSLSLLLLLLLLLHLIQSKPQTFLTLQQWPTNSPISPSTPSTPDPSSSTRTPPPTTPSLSTSHLSLFPWKEAQGTEPTQSSENPSFAWETPCIATMNTRRSPPRRPRSKLNFWVRRL